MKLRDVHEDDLGVLFAQQCEPEAARMAEFSPRDQDAFMTHWRSNVLGNASAETRIIELDGEVAGYVTRWGARDKWFLGYWLGERYWGRGVATAAVARFVKIDVVRPLHAIVASRNVASIRVLAKCGFVELVDPSERATVLADDEDGILLRLDV